MNIFYNKCSSSVIAFRDRPWPICHEYRMVTLVGVAAAVESLWKACRSMRMPSSVIPLRRRRADKRGPVNDVVRLTVCLGACMRGEKRATIRGNYGRFDDAENEASAWNGDWEKRNDELLLLLLLLLSGGLIDRQRRRDVICLSIWQWSAAIKLTVDSTSTGHNWSQMWRCASHCNISTATRTQNVQQQQQR